MTLYAQNQAVILGLLEDTPPGAPTNERSPCGKIQHAGFIRLATMCRRAGPLIPPGQTNKPSAHRIAFDIASRAKQMVGVHREREEAILPQVPASAMQLVDVFGVEPMRAADGQCKRIGALGGDDQMHVIRHEAIRENREAVALRLLCEDSQIGPSIIVAEEDILAVVAALRDMVGQTGNDDSRDPRHRRQRSRYG